MADGDRRQVPSAVVAGGAGRWYAQPATLLLLIAGGVVSTSPLDAYVVFNVPFMRNPSAVLGILLVVSFLLVRAGRLRVFSLPQVLALVFIGVVVIMELTRLALADVSGFAGSASLPLVAILLMTWIQPVVLFLIITDVARSERAVGLVLFGLPFVLSVLSLELFTSSVAGRWSPLGLNENHAGSIYGMAFLISVWWLLRRAPRVWHAATIAFVATLPLLLAGLLATGSRGATAAAAVGLVVLLAGSLRPVRLLTIVALAVPGVLYFGQTLDGLAAPLVARWERAIVDDTQRGGRDTIAAATFETAMRQPFTGHGLQANVVVGEAVRGEARNLSPHNTYLSLLVTFGLLGAIPWFLVLITVGVGVWRHREHDTAWLFMALGALFLTVMLVGDVTASKYLFSVMALATCLPMWVAERRSRAFVRPPSFAPSGEAAVVQSSLR